jgi:hypothetical protein
MWFLAEALRKVQETSKRKVALLNSGKLFDWGAEKELLLSGIGEGNIYKFLSEFDIFLRKIFAALGY